MKSRRIHKRTRHAKRTKRHTKRTKKYARRMRGGNGMRPFVGAPYNAAAAYPQGNYYEYNAAVKAAPAQSNALLEEGVMRGMVRAGGGRSKRSRGKRSGHKRSRGKRSRGKRSGHKRSRGKRSGHKRSGHKRSRGRHMRGGGLSQFMSSIIPEEALNVGRSVPSAIGHAYDKFTGVLSTPSSMVYPTQQPLVYAQDEGISRMPPPTNIMKLYENVNNTVAAM